MAFGKARAPRSCLSIFEGCKTFNISISYLQSDGLFLRCGQWHEVVTFRWREPPPIGCGFPYDLELENRAYGGPQTGPENPLDRICSPANIRAVDYPSFTNNLPTNLYPSGVSYERVGLSEVPNMKTPRDSGFPLGVFFSAFLEAFIF